MKMDDKIVEEKKNSLNVHKDNMSSLRIKTTLGLPVHKRTVLRILSNDKNVKYGILMVLMVLDIIDTILVSNSSKTWFQREHIALLLWLTKSPDLNPIENVWCSFVREVAKIIKLMN